MSCAVNPRSTALPLRSPQWPANLNRSGVRQMQGARIAALLDFFGVVPTGNVANQRDQLAAIIGTSRF